MSDIPEPDPQPEEYNTGSEDDRRKALDSVYDYNKTLITLATGTLALSATFLAKDLYYGEGQSWLVWSWGLLGLSILFGLVGLGAYVSQYAESDIRPRHSLLEYLSLVQVLGLLVGLGFLGIFAIQNAKARAERTSSTTTVTTGTSVTSTSGASSSTTSP
jgi:hypothetical protein